MKIKKFIIHNSLFIILFIAATLRLWNLASIPPHLTPDEAALGYNAYSILKTGRDEYGEFLPIIFKSFGDYKPGFYVYLTVPFVAIFGLNEFSVRLTSAVAGVIAVWLIYKIVQSLITNLPAGKAGHFSLVTAALAAINPWLIHFSRGAWEANVSLTLALAGIYFFFKSLLIQKYLILSALFFALTLVTYQGAKLSTATLVIILVSLYFKNLVKFDKKILVKSFILGLVISTPIFLSLFQGKTGRLTVFSIFSHRRPNEYLQNFLDQGGEKIGDISYYLFHSEILNTKKGIFGRWFNHFSGRFLFFEGDWQNPRHSSPNHGVLLLSDIFFLVLGLTSIVKNGLRKDTLFILLWLTLAPLPAALSRDQVHAIRALNMVVPLVILISLGAKLVAKRHFFIIFCFFYLVSFLFYLDSYFIHLPKHDSKYWEYGYRQIVEEVSRIQSRYKIIKVRQSFAQPYIYFLFFQKYDPVKYQNQAKLVESVYGDVGQVEKLDNICFCPIDWSINRGESGTLFVADPIRIPPEDSSDPKYFNLIKEIKYLNGETAFRIVEVK